MDKDTTVTFSNPAFRDELSEVVRHGARQIIRQAVEAELHAFVEEHAAERDGRGRRSVVRNGYLPSREVLTGIGPVRVRVPRTRERSGAGRCFRSELLPPYLKKTRRVEAVVPWLYLKGVSTNDFEEALQALFGESVKGLSAASVARLKGGWEVEYAQWRERDWGGEEFVYLWADGIYVNVRNEDRRCLLVVVGCDVRGYKHFLALDAGFRESKESWKAVLLSLRDRGVKAAKLAVGDGGSGVLVGPGRGVPRNPGAALLGAQDGERARQASQTPCRAARSRCCMRSGGRIPGRERRKRSNASSPPGRRSTPGPPSAWPGIGRRFWPSTTSRRLTGSICAPPTPSSRPSPPLGCERRRPGTA